MILYLIERELWHMALYNVQLFQGLDETFKEEINKHAKLVKFQKKESLFCADELMHYFYVIISGKIKSYQLNLQNAKEQTISILRSGDMFDTIILLDGKPHDVMYESLDITEVLQFPITKVREWITTNKAFNQKFFPYLASQMRQVEELATDLSLHSTSHRLIKLLLQNLDHNNREKYNLIQGLSHSEIAKLIGTVRHVVERHLHKLKSDGVVETNRKNFNIKSIEKLIQKLDS